MSDHPTDPALNRLAADLRNLAPSAGVNRDRVLFEAGRRSARSRGWPMATGAFAALSALLAVRLATTPAPTGRIEIVHEPAPVVVPSAPESVAVVDHRQRRLGLVDRLFPERPIVSQPGSLRLRDEWLSGGPAEATLTTPSPSSPPVERWLGLPSRLFFDSPQLHPNIGSSRGEV